MTCFESTIGVAKRCTIEEYMRQPSLLLRFWVKDETVHYCTKTGNKYIMVQARVYRQPGMDHNTSTSKTASDAYRCLRRLLAM